MSNINTGGPAFPGVEYKAPVGGGNHMMTIVGGMTLRDYFAAKAMQGLLAADTEFVLEPSNIAAEAYGQADAMLEVREE